MLPLVGELAATVVARAIGNAIFAVVGVRLRYLPIRPPPFRKRSVMHGDLEGRVLGLPSTRPQERISPMRFNA
jgi:hypothetical protein